VFSPSGSVIAVGTVVSKSSVGSTGGSLLVLPVAGGQPRMVVPFQANFCQIPGGWTADGSRVLVWQDAACSASIAADGLTLDAVPVAGGPLVSLGTSLVNTGWVVPTAGVNVLVDRGDSRVAADHKALQSCSAATGLCAPLPLPPRVSTLDPALAPAARLLFEVRVAQSSLFTDFLPHGTLWLTNGAGTGAKELTAAGSGVADPVPARDGSTVTFVRMTSPGSATVSVLTVRSGAVRVLASVDLADYYGEFQSSRVLAVWQPR
jgi:hypothetical protein